MDPIAGMLHRVRMLFFVGRGGPVYAEDCLRLQQPNDGALFFGHRPEDPFRARYYRNPEATSEILKDGWLYTGDMARMDGEGFIYLVDRKKDVGAKMMRRGRLYRGSSWQKASISSWVQQG